MNHFDNLTLPYSKPADHFNEAMPVGNGRIGAMVFGQTHREHLVLNEDSCWAGKPRNRINPRSKGALNEIRESLFAARYAQADAAGRERFLGEPSTIDSYQPMGELDLRVGWRAPVFNYRRWLDLDGAVAVCEWREGGLHHRRTVFCSAPDQVLVVRHEMLEGLGSPLSARLTREGPGTELTSIEGDLLLTGHAYAHASHYGSGFPSLPPSGTGVSLAIRLRAHLNEGRQAVLGQHRRVADSRQVIFLIAMSTGAREDDPAMACKKVLDTASSFSYDELLARHQRDHRALFRAFAIQLGGEENSCEIVDRLQGLREGNADPGLFALACQHRRYLLIAASRPGSLPSTLQGLWTEQQQGPWNCDYHFNINLQMNYWLAEPTGLGECVEPLIDWVQAIIPDGERTARELYGCRGWTLHHLSDAWGTTEPMDGIWGLWPWGAAWIVLHLHDRWLYSGDRNVLTRIWPIMRGAVEFVLDFLMEGPAGCAHAGLLTTCPSHSPENAFITHDGSSAKFTYGATMDFGICRALFAACLEELTALQIEPELYAQIVLAKSRIPALMISPSTGGIQEWAQDFVEADPGHRHVAHLFDLHPGIGISLQNTPSLAAAARNTLERKARYQTQTSHDQPGWALNWMACHWARLGDAEQAYARLHRLLTDYSTPNLCTFAHDQIQMADACGTAAAICEMIVQEHEGYVHLLPALPIAFTDGSITGLHLRYAVQLTMSWKNREVTTARFVAAKQARIRVKLPPHCAVSTSAAFTATGNGISEFNLSPGVELRLTSNAATHV